MLVSKTSLFLELELAEDGQVDGMHV